MALLTTLLKVPQGIQCEFLLIFSILSLHQLTMHVLASKAFDSRLAPLAGIHSRLNDSALANCLLHSAAVLLSPCLPMLVIPFILRIVSSLFNTVNRARRFLPNAIVRVNAFLRTAFVDLYRVAWRSFSSRFFHSVRHFHYVDLIGYLNHTLQVLDSVRFLSETQSPILS